MTNETSILESLPVAKHFQKCTKCCSVEWSSAIMSADNRVVLECNKCPGQPEGWSPIQAKEPTTPFLDAVAVLDEYPKENSLVDSGNLYYAGRTLEAVCKTLTERLEIAAELAKLLKPLKCTCFPNTGGKSHIEGCKWTELQDAIKRFETLEVK